MNPQIQLGKNALWMILSRFGAQGLTIVFTIALARRLGSAGFGEYAFIAAILFVANTLTTFGTDMLLIREIAAQDNLSRLSAALVVQLMLSSIFIIAIWLTGSSIPNQNPETVMALKIYSLALIPLAFFTVFTTALRGKQNMDMYALLSLVVSGLQVAAAFLSKISLIELTIVLVVIQTIAAAVAGFICLTTIPNFAGAWREPFSNVFLLVREAAPIAWIALLGMLYQRLSITMLSTMRGPTDTGIFSAAARMVEASKGIHIAVFAALYPAMAFAQTDLANQNRWIQAFKLSWKMLIAAAIASALILSIFSAPLTALFYGSQFNVSAGILGILAWILIPFTINTYLTLSFFAANKERLVVRALTASLLGLLILNLWLIPLKGPEGAAWSALLAECIQSAILTASAVAQIRIHGEAHELSKLF
ncbi:MAG: oligosaccharide flippase family protein [Chloroflexi bacterium]|nr:oligosaccharide flippase family protein [Chloroflexota bacterium]